MFKFLRRKRIDPRFERAVWVDQPSKGDILDALPNDEARERQCMEWAEKARNDWFQGLRECVQDVVLSDNPRYRQYSEAARRRIGERNWGSSAKAKELAGAEQMYGRWATLYRHSVRSREDHLWHPGGEQTA